MRRRSPLLTQREELEEMRCGWTEKQVRRVLILIGKGSRKGEEGDEAERDGRRFRFRLREMSRFRLSRERWSRGGRAG